MKVVRRSLLQCLCIATTCVMGMATNTEALAKLLNVFGMNQPGRRERHYTPPQYMVDLYNAIADSSGRTHADNPYHANIVRSFPDLDISNPLHFYFNFTSNPGAKERLLEAEFHLYKLKPRTRLPNRYMDARSHLLEVRIYQVMSRDRTFLEEGNRLLDVRRISLHSVGWEVFYIKPAVLDWQKNDGQDNFGLLVTAKTMTGAPVERGVVRFAKRHQHHLNKQPILVVFADDGRPRQTSAFSKINFRDYGYPELSVYSFQGESSSNGNGTASVEAAIPSSTISRARRSDEKSSSPADAVGSCTRHELYVDFEQIGWSTWIISPKGYNAFYCKGECTFPLGQDQWPTNHATVQSIVNELSLTADVSTPCCVPNKLFSISLLFFDENGNVILKQYDDMVAASCGCH